MPRHQQAKIHEIEHQEPRHLGGRDIGAAHIVAEQRHLAEERAFAERHFLAGQFDLGLAGGDEIHAVALLALADDHGARRQVHGSQHMRDVGDRGRAEVSKERHLADGLPGLQKIVAAGLGGKAGRQNAGPEPEHAEAGDHDQRRDHAAERRDRHHVAIAGGGQRHHRPPQRRRHAAEGPRLHVALQEIFRDRRQKHHHQEDHEHAEQRP